MREASRSRDMGEVRRCVGRWTWRLYGCSKLYNRVSDYRSTSLIEIILPCQCAMRIVHTRIVVTTLRGESPAPRSPRRRVAGPSESLLTEQAAVSLPATCAIAHAFPPAHLPCDRPPWQLPRSPTRRQPKEARRPHQVILHRASTRLPCQSWRCRLQPEGSPSEQE